MTATTLQAPYCPEAGEPCPLAAGSCVSSFCQMESPERRFARWLTRALGERGWSQADLARRSQLSSSHVSRLLSGARRPRTEACTRIAQALHVSQASVFQQAGLIRNASHEPPEVDELCTIARLLPEQDRRDLLLSARDRLARSRGEKRGS